MTFSHSGSGSRRALLVSMIRCDLTFMIFCDRSTDKPRCSVWMNQQHMAIFVPEVLEDEWWIHIFQACLCR